FIRKTSSMHRQVLALIVISFIVSISHSGQAQSRADKLIMKHLKGKKIEHFEYFGEDYVRVKIKKKWGVYQAEVYEDEVYVDEIIPAVFDSIGWFTGMEPFTIVKNNGKYGLLLNPGEIYDAAEKVKCKYDKVQMRERDGEYFALAKNDKWGLIDWFEGALIVDYIFDTPGEVPLITMDSWEIETMQRVKKHLNCDLVVFDYINGDGALIARNPKTKKWGMYQATGEGDPSQMIPMEYDSIRFFPWNASFTAVYNEGKVGFYLSRWSFDEQATLSVPCIYDDFRRFDDGRVKRLACKRDGGWGWVDWLTGEEKSEFKYANPEDLPHPSYKQDQWFNDY
ncbi:MAG: hypothetical protein ABJZ92_17495, partial [Cyclobacteriaceae bacterium]